MRAVLDDPRSVSGLATRRLPSGSRGGRSDRLPVGGRSALRRRGRLHDDRGGGADRREALARPRAHINAVGSCFPTTRELDTETVAHSSFFTDRRESCLNEAGDYILAAAEGAVGPDHIKAELGEVLAGIHPGREHEDELTVFESLGIAVEDLRPRSWSCGARASRASGRGRLLIPLADIERARGRIAGVAIRTPLIRLHVDAPAEIWLKLENLQPIGSFKLRGAANAILSAPRALADGVVTTSTGNMAQGVAWMARELGVPATIVVPDNASASSSQRSVERLGGRIVRLPGSSGGRLSQRTPSATSATTWRGTSCTRPGRSRDGGQRHDRPRAGGDHRRLRRRPRPLGQGVA